jgi:carbamate kinase
MPRVVIALGGNALQKNGETDAESQKQVAREAARQLATLAREGYQLAITHGNGPQVGAILLNEEAAAGGPAPLDTCVAMSQGQIGYWLQQSLGNELRAQGIDKTVATIVTQVLVSGDDPAFGDPSKPIGPFYPNAQAANAAAAERHFVVKEDAGRGWRRVVASPQPLDIIEKGMIKRYLGEGYVIIAGGGGGIPVVKNNGEYQGVEAVIDKDFAAEKLAELIEADVLLILTAVDAVSINFRQPDETKLETISAAALSQYAEQGQFAPGSMLPKVQAALQFVHTGSGRVAIITSIAKATDALHGKAGTRVINQA